MGKQAATFVPSGTMGNLIGIAVNAQRGEELIADADSHAFYYETAGAAAVCGVQIRPIATEAGVMSPQQVAQAVRPRDDPHQPITAAITFENTHNRHGGIVWPLEALRAASDAAHEQGLRVHLDGARIFNASAATGKSVAELSRKFDSVMFCLSKGLAAPVGSMLLGSKEFIEKARIYRKAMGGGMRQAGVLAAAGLIALEKMPARLQEDHENARLIAEGLAQVPGIKIDAKKVVTNILVFDVSGTGMDAADFNQKLATRNVLANAIGPELMRFVTHLNVSREDCLEILDVVKALCKNSN